MQGWKRIFNEPVMLGTVIRTGLLMLMAFGVGLTMVQLAAVMVFVESLTALTTRAYVTPNHLAEQRVAMGNSPTTPLTNEQKSNLPPAASILLIGVLSLGALGLPACSGTPPPATSPTANLSASGRAAYHATRAVKALDLLRDIAITAEQQHPKLMSTDSTRKVVLYHQSVVKTIAAVPEGWLAVAEQGLVELQKQIPAEEWLQIDPYVRLVLALYKETR
jgi:hypothetical protein